MKTTILACILFVGIVQELPAQTHPLFIRIDSSSLFLDHAVVAKENWYSVGRLYNLTPNALAAYNGSSLTKPLVVGQALKIPLTAKNFAQNESKLATESLIPLYHTVAAKEWMYHISSTFNKVPVATLEKWNHITSDQVKAGMPLIVGYLKVITAQSPLASETNPGEAPPITPANPVATTTSSQGAKPADSSLKKQANHPKTTIAPVEPAASTVSSVSGTQPIAPVVSTSSASNPVNSNAGPGFFSKEFGGTGKSQSGQAGTFKSNSGWQDEKYYALMNNVPVGSILRVTNPATRKTIYAKVLGSLPDMKESAGLLIRISNSAAAALGSAEGKFSAEVAY